MVIVLEGINPTAFNLYASFFAEILQLATAYVLGELFRWLLSQYLRRGKTIPIAALGRLPGGLIDSFHVASAMEWAPPAVFILVLFASDYATTIAFAGLGFETTVRPGPEAPVLSLERRNDAFPYDAIGDPAMDKTMSKLEVLLGRSGDNRIDQDTLFELDQQQNSVASFLEAADAIARGESVFLAQNELVQHSPTLPGLSGGSNDLGELTDTDSVILFAQDSFLTAVNLAVPLDCFGVEGDKEAFMLEINEERGDRLDFRTTSKLPNCNFLSPRSSGIFDEGQANRAEITAHASSQSVSLYMLGGGNKTKAKFFFPPSGFPLARDRPGDFRQGRVVLGFGGVIYGNIDIPFHSTTVASGSLIQEDFKQYTLVSQIDPERFPKDPSQAVNTTCLAVTSLECRVFPTEFETAYLEMDPKECDLLQVDLLWGRNFDVDSQLIAAIGGVHSRNAGWANTRRRKQTVTLHSVPAALFMLGSIEFRASNEEVKSTSIDSIFITFMCLPVGMCLVAGLVFLLGVKHLVAIPDDGCKMIQLGAEGAGTTIDASLDGKRVPQSSHMGLIGERIVLKYDGLNSKQKVRRLTLDASLEGGNSSDQTRASASASVHCDSPVEGKLGKQKVRRLTLDASLEEGNSSDQTRASASASVHCDSSVEGNSGLTCDEGDHDQRNSPIHFGEMDGRVGPINFDPQPSSTSRKREGDDPQRNRVADLPPQCHRHLDVVSGVGDDGNTCDPICRPDERRDGSAVRKSSLNQQHSSRDSFNKIRLSLAPSSCNQNAVDLDRHERGKQGFPSPFGEQPDGPQPGLMAPSDYSGSMPCYKDGGMTPDSEQNNPSPCDGRDLLIDSHPSGEDLPHDCSSGDAESDSEREVIEDGDQDRCSSNTGGGTEDQKPVDVPLQESYRRNILYVMGCIAFSVTLLILGGVFVKVKRVSGSQGSPLSTATDSRNEIAEGRVPADRCFRNRLDLAAAVSAHFDGPPEKRSQVMDDYGPMEHWCVDKIEDFSYLFSGRRFADEDISTWNVSNGRSFSHCFFQSSFQGDLSTWDVSQSTDFSGMFAWAPLFNSNLSSWNVSGGIDFSYMFHHAASFNSDLSSWNVSHGEDFSWMLSERIVLSSNFSSWDVSNAIWFTGLFSDTSFNGDLSGWDVSRGRDFRWMFREAHTFNGDLSRWNVSNSVTFEGMFEEAWSFNGDLSSWDVSNVKSFDKMFAFAVKFEGDLSGWDVSSGETFRQMFSDAKRFNGDLTGWDVSSGYDFGWMFNNAEKFNGDISDWDVSNGFKFVGMFVRAYEFTQDLCPWLSKFSENVDLEHIFVSTSCPTSDTQFAMCHWCIGQPTSAPTSTAQPTTACGEGRTRVVVELTTDRFSQDTTWTIVDQDDKIIEDGPPPETPSYRSQTTYEVKFCLPDGLYNFTIYDAYGDGICCTHGDGSFSVVVDGNLVVSGGQFQQESMSIPIQVSKP